MPLYRRCLATGLINLGAQLKKRGQPTEAEATCRQALAVREQLAADYPAVPQYRQDLAHSHNNLGGLLRDLGQRAEAEAAFRRALSLQEQLAADFPAVVQYRLDLAGGQVNLGHVLKDDGQPSAALEWYGQGIDTLRAVRAKDPRRTTAREYLRNAHWGRASALDALGRHADAAQDWEQAIDLDPGLSRAALRAQRALSLARAGDAERATAAADELARTPAQQGSGSAYDAACVFAVLSGVLTDATQKEHHARRAVELLTQARDRGFFQEPAKRAWLQKNPELEPLRSRNDFQKLLAPPSA
jgi:tetratricopeptide (TPR) repeat protein